MSSLNRVLRNAPVAEPAFGNGGRAFVDDWMAELLDQARAEAFEAGRREGFAAGRTDVEGAIARIDEAVRNAIRDLARIRAEAVAETVDAALQVATFVVGELPFDDGAALSARIRAAIDSLDDEDLEVAVHPNDWDSVAAMVRLPNGVSMERDPSLRPGEARIMGRWASAELTRDAALSVAREVLA